MMNSGTVKRVLELRFDLKEQVRLKEINRPGVVIAAIMDELGIQYRVAYWNDGARRTEWVFGEEIEAVEGTQG